MGKFFKVFGIGAAIGTLAYGIFKYKHDQKFKEKVDEKTAPTKEKAKKVAEKAIDKACIFTVDHPGLVLGMMAGTVVGVSALGGIAANKKLEKYRAKLELKKRHPLEGKDLEQHEKWWNDHGYGDNFRDVYEFAKTLSLHDNEAFGLARIEDNGQMATCVLQEYDDETRAYTKMETI
jgi:hypothetical protein